MPHVHAFATRHGDAAVTGPGLVAEDLLQAYLDRLAATGRGNAVYERAARKFLRTWPDPEAWAEQPLADRLAAGNQTSPPTLRTAVNSLAEQVRRHDEQLRRMRR